MNSVVPESHWADGRHFGGRVGGERTGLVVIDLQRGFTTPGAPLAVDAVSALGATGRLLDAARAALVPIWFTAIAYDQDEPLPLWSSKIPALRHLRDPSPWAELDPLLARRQTEKVVVKKGASAVFGTDLLEQIRAADLDSVLLVGASTSGCVRATAVDLMQGGIAPLLVREGCADRDTAQAEAAFTDVSAKYGEVIPLEQALAHLAGTRAGEPGVEVRGS